MSVVAIIVAAGRGSRAGGGVPKQYRALAGLPVIARTLTPFLASDQVGAVVCAIHPDDHDLYDGAVSGLAGAGKLLPPVHGGATRQDSVARAVAALGAPEPDRICLVHDAARPFADGDLIRRAVAAAEAFGAAVPGIPVTDTVNRIGPDGRIVETLPRDALRAVQTPQAFRLDLLADAHRRATAEGLADFTDDGQLARWAGSAVHVFPGHPGNVKLTRAADFDEAERRLGGPGGAMITRVGTGFDVHAFGEGDHVWLGGIRIDHVRGVLAHSDGDVVLHALTDALLGAIGDGDIGTHFPPSDPQWRGASSDRFLDHAATLVRARGGVIDHLDITVLCERPRIGPHRDAIRARIAAIVRVPVSAVSIKATTTERLGFTGREEGLAAQAAATIRLPEEA